MNELTKEYLENASIKELRNLYWFGDRLKAYEVDLLLMEMERRGLFGEDLKNTP